MAVFMHCSNLFHLKLAASLLTAAGFAGAALASSPAAWTAHDKEVAASCIKSSGLKNAKAVGRPMAYDDSIGLTALFIAGRYPQPHMKNRSGRVLCLFDRKTRESVVTEADQLSVSSTPATSRK